MKKNKNSVLFYRRLRDKLIENERLSLAMEVSTKCGLDPAGVWVTWGMMCLQGGNFTGAREKFIKCLKVRSDMIFFICFRYLLLPQCLTLSTNNQSAVDDFENNTAKLWKMSARGSFNIKKSWKHCGKSNFCFYHTVFKCRQLQMRKNEVKGYVLWFK